MNQKWKLRITACLLAFVMCLPLAESQLLTQAAGTARNAEPVVTWKSNFGGSDSDTYNAVAVVEDGYVAVGSSYGASFGTGDWAEVKSNDDPEDRWAGDAIIVKYDTAGNVLWKKNFGGRGWDAYYSVAAVKDGYVAAGSSYGASFGTGDWTGKEGNDDLDDPEAKEAILVKYDTAGNVLWKKNFGGRGWDVYSAVTAVEDGYIAVGGSFYKSFGTGDWTGTGCHDEAEKSGAKDAIIVKYDTAGNLLWKKNFGGAAGDWFTGVTAAKGGGCVAVGYSYRNSFGSGDWMGVKAKGEKSTGITIADSNDAIIVKYDTAGNMLWKKNFGGSSYDEYDAVTAVDDGYVAVGYSFNGSFQDGDWIGEEGKGHDDAVIVKYDTSGNVLWKRSLGGSDADYYHAVTAVEDGYIAVGDSRAASFGTGDWTGIEGDDDAVIVKYDTTGKMLWKENFGGGEWDSYNAVAAVKDGHVAVGYSDPGFGFGDWTGVSGKGLKDAIIVRYTEPDDSADSSDYSYDILDDGTLKITRYSGMATNLTIPEKIDGRKVTSIGGNVFWTRNTLTSVNLPDGITDISSSAFGGCSNLTDINVSEGNKFYRSYDGCLYSKDGLKILRCPNGKSEANLLSGVKTIDSGSFSGCSRLANISIPNSVTKIAYGVFSSCTSLKNVYYAGSASQWKKINISSNNEKLTSAMIYYATPDAPDNTLTAITLSDKTLSLKKGAKKKLAYTLTPSTATATVLFTTSNRLVATVDSKGIITAKKKGTATITAKASGLKATCKVTVTEEKKPKTPALTVKLNSANGVKLSWKKVSGAQGYYVYRATSKYGSYKKIKTVKGTSYVNNKLKNGKTYYYKVAAYKGSLSSAKSKVKSKKIIGKPSTPKVKLTVNRDSGVFTVSWSNVKRATHIEILSKQASGRYDSWKTLPVKDGKASYAFTGKGTIILKLRAYYTMDGKTIYSGYSKECPINR